MSKPSVALLRSRMHTVDAQGRRIVRCAVLHLREQPQHGLLVFQFPDPPQNGWHDHDDPGLVEQLRLRRSAARDAPMVDAAPTLHLTSIVVGPDIFHVELRADGHATILRAIARGWTLWYAAGWLVDGGIEIDRGIAVAPEVGQTAWRRLASPV